MHKSIDFQPLHPLVLGKSLVFLLTQTSVLLTDTFFSRAFK
jgi:hypothetical protein